MGKSQDSDQNSYGGYRGNRDKSSSQEDPYGAFNTPSSPSSSSSSNYQYGQQQRSQQQQSQQQQQQQQSSYQPPTSVSRGHEPISKNARRSAALSYGLIFFGGLFYFLVERRNRFVRFAAAQSMLVFGPLTLLYVLFSLLPSIWVVGWLFAGLVPCLTGIVVIVGGLLWLALIGSALTGRRLKLPYVGDIAERITNSTMKP